MKKSIIPIDKAIEINKENMELLSKFCDGLKNNIENLKKKKAKGETEMPDTFTRVEIDFKSYYIPKN